MKISILPSLFFLSLTLGCATTPPSHTDSSSATTVEADGMGTIDTSPTPNIPYESETLGSTTVMDPEGDIAPMIPCKEGEIKRRQSGKIVCVNPDRDRSGSTMSGR